MHSPISVWSASEPGLHYIVRGLPGLLVAAPFPHRLQPDWDTLKRAGIAHVVCLASTKPECRYDLWPFGLDWLAKINCIGPMDMAWILTPSAALAERESGEYHEARDEWLELQRIAKKVWLSCLAGEGVLVHCEYGVERTGLLIALVLMLAEQEPLKIFSGLTFGLLPSQPVPASVVDAWKALLAIADFDGMEL